MRHSDERRHEDAARLHERAALFYDLLDHRDRAAAERERAKRFRGAPGARPSGDDAGIKPRAQADGA